MQQNPLIKEYLDIAFRRKWWIVLPAVIGLLFAVALFFNFPKLYRAETKVAIRDQTISRDLLRPVIDLEHADLVTRINGEITSEQYVLQLDRALRIIGSEDGPADQSELAKRLEGAIQVDSNPRDRYFTLKVVWNDPRLAASIANELAAIYIQRNRDIRADMAGEAVNQLRNKREDYEQQLTKIREAISRFRGEHKFELDSYQRTNEQQLANNRTDIQRINSEIRSLSNSIEKTELDRDSLVTTGGVPDRDPRLERLQALREELRLARLNFKPAHPKRQRLEKELASLEAEFAGRDDSHPVESNEGYLKQRYDQEIARLKNEIAVREKAREELFAKNVAIEARLKVTPDRQNELNRMLQRERNLAVLFEEAYSRENKALEGQTLEEFQAGEKFDVLNSAVAPSKPFWPDLRLFLLMGIAIGGGLGVAVVLLLEVFDQSFKSEEQLAASIDYPILAVIPDLHRAAERSKRRGKTRVRGKKAS